MFGFDTYGKVTAGLMLTAVLVLGGSCAKFENIYVSEEGKVPVSFSTYGRKPLSSKADASYVAPGQDFSTGATIGVYGFYHDGDGATSGSWTKDGSSNIPDFMYNQAVTKQDDGSWTYSPLKYWPNEHGTDASSQHIDKLSFWGYYPRISDTSADSPMYSGTDAKLRFFKEGSTTQTYTNATSGLPSVTFTQSEDLDKMVDLMFSDPLKDVYKNQSHIVDGNENHYGAVNNGELTLKFRHALSLVEFRLREGTGATVNSMTLTNIKKSGVCSDPTAATLVWDSSASSEYTITVSNEVINDRNLMTMVVMPQDINSNATFSLNYDIRYASADGTEDIVYKGDSFSVKLYRKTGPVADQYGVTAWEAGHHYIYWITAGLDRIEFDEIVDSPADDWTLWTDPDDSTNHDIDVQ